MMGFALGLIASPLLLVGASTPVRTAASAATATVPAITWLAAGDSYSSGQGLNDTTEPCARGDFKQGSFAYPIVAYDDLHVSFPEFKYPSFVACTGATTPDLIADDDAAGQPEWVPSMGKFDLVTFTFGGNDVDFASIITQCVFGSLHAIAPPDPGHTCPSDAYVRRLIATRLGATYQRFLTKVADTIVARGGNIVVLGYPEFVELPKFWPSVLQHIGKCQGIRTSDATQLRGDAGDLNATIGHDVVVVNSQHPNGVHLTFVDVNTGSDPGPVTIASTDQNLFEPSTGGRHDLCGTGTSWMNGLVKLHLTTRSFHPSELGNKAEGRLLAEVVPHLTWPSPTTVPPPPTVSKAWTPAEEPLPPGGVKLVPSSDLPFDNLSCAGAGFCAAIGVYADNDGNEHGLLEVLSDGVWTATKAPVPANGGPSGDPLLWGVSCAQVGFCVAVGGYTGSNRRMSGLIETLAGGKWIATEAPLPARASWSNGLAAVSCVGDDYCVAGGGYSTSDGFDEGLLETLSGDVWTASEAPLPANAIGVPDTSSISMGLQLVSCGSARSCAAVGWYKTSDLPNAIVLETLSGGVWTATQATLPANIRAVFNFAMTSISCSQAGLCVAVGFYDHSDGEGADVIETLSGGIWTFGIAPKPANPEPGELPVLYSVSCAASGFCAAVGQGFIETLAGGLWTVSEASPPSNPDGSSATVSGLQSVSCARPGSCVAVGEYGSPNRPLGGLIELLADGKWTATEASLPANGGKRGESRLDAASCGEVESCVALGDYSVGERTEGLIDAG